MNRISGVVDAEASLALPIELEHNGVTSRLSIYGLDEDATLLNIIDITGNRHRPEGGIILSLFHAEELGVSEGQTVAMHIPHVQKTVYVEVSRVIEESVTIGAYMDISDLCMLFGSEIVSNMILINVEDEFMHEVHNELSEAFNVLWYNDNARALEALREAFLATTSILSIIVIISVIICFAVIYNTASISLGEKKREYATLRVLGYHVSEVSGINTFEFVLTLIIGSILGTIISFFTTPTLATFFDNEQLTLNAGISLQSTVLSFVCCAIAVFISCGLIRLQIKKFVLAIAMKERD